MKKTSAILKKTISVILATLMMALVAATALASFAKTTDDQILPGVPTPDYLDDQFIPGMPNPFTDVDSLDDATAITGFTMKVPAKAAGCKQAWINATDNMIQVCYKSKTNEVRIRKAKGFVKNLDGDYNTYSLRKYKFIKGKLVKERCEYLLGNEDTNYTVYVANWTSGGYTYSVTADNGMTQKQLNSIVKAVK